MLSNTKALATYTIILSILEIGIVIYFCMKNATLIP